MFQNLDVFKTAMAMAKHAGAQQAYSAQNIANADTPGYRAKTLPKFHTYLRNGVLKNSVLHGDRFQTGNVDSFEPILTDNTLDPNGNSVSLEQEMISGVNAKRQHDRALAIYKSSLSMLRTSVGRR